MSLPGTARRRVVITGATGYLGCALAADLVARGHDVVGVVRPGRAGRLPPGARAAEADALRADALAAVFAPGDTVVHLVGTPRPSPAKGAAFRAVDLPSIAATTTAAAARDVAHLVYVSVAHPAPVMHDYIAVRVEGERLVAATGLPSTVLRPWYVLGPGHRWPYVLLPLYAVLSLLPRTRQSARRLGLLRHGQMRAALVHAVEHPPAAGVHVLDVPAIRTISG